MKILYISHSFVPYTMAGTEVYSYKLSKELAKQHKVFVFFRVNNPKEQEYSLTYQRFEGLETYAINHTFRYCNTFSDTYNDKAIDTKLSELLNVIKPDIVHIHHLLFLSHGIIREIKKRNIPIVYTLHDYWLICYRGQLLKNDLTVCERNFISECNDCLKYLLSIRRHSIYLYSILRKKLPVYLLTLLKRLYWVNPKSQTLKELKIWKDSVEEIRSKIDLFIAPSHFIRNKFLEQGFTEDKILYSPHGFDGGNFIFIPKSKSNILRFGYMGTLLPMKGLDILISAFKEVKNKNIELSIFGKLFAYTGFEFYPDLLKRMASNDGRIKLKGEYANKDVDKILSNIDVLIVPSIWLENASLVIQEAFLSKIPVIASRIGGIPELVIDGVNGLLFNPRDVNDLQEKIQYIIDNPNVIEKFKGNIPKVKSMEDNSKKMEEIYSKLIAGVN